jgi:hypothetical protein
MDCPMCKDLERTLKLATATTRPAPLRIIAPARSLRPTRTSRWSARRATWKSTSWYASSPPVHKEARPGKGRVAWLLGFRRFFLGIILRACLLLGS